MKPLESLPRPPKELSPRARRYWRRVGRELIRRKILTEADLLALRLFCETAAQCEEVRELLAQATDPGEQSVLRQALWDCERDLLRWAYKFVPISEARQLLATGGIAG